ncbi:hypothetical protein DFAR_3800039 [Desulfarculales bacterium]
MGRNGRGGSRAFDEDTASFSRAVLTKLTREQVLEIAQVRKKKSVLIIDEASLSMRQVWPNCPSSPSFRETPSQSSLPLASRVVDGSIWPAAPSRTCRPTSCTISKSQASTRAFL